MFDYGRNIGCQEVFICSDADDEGTAISSSDYFFGIFVNDAKSVCALQERDGFEHCFFERIGVILSDEMNDDFRIGF